LVLLLLGIFDGAVFILIVGTLTPAAPTDRAEIVRLDVP
jgi:hypothetical protein